MKQAINSKFDYDPDTGVVTHREGKPRWGGKVAGTVNAHGYIMINCTGTPEAAHRMIWEHFNGKIPEGMEIDHINRIKTDNRLCNLRLVDRSGNSINKGRRADNSSGVPGTYYRERTGNYEVYGSIDGKWTYLGVAHTLEQASEMRVAVGLSGIEV